MRGVKVINYAAHGVREYWIIDPSAEVLEQYLLTGEGAYELHRKIASGDVVSPVIKGLQFSIRALFADAENLAALRVILSAVS